MTSNPKTDSFAYVTLVTSDDFVIGAQLLAYSLRKHHCNYPLLCIITQNLTPHSRALLTASHYTLLLVHPLPCPFPSHNPSWSDVGLTKLRLFSLTHYTRLLYIDADCLALHNVDHLFHTPHSACRFPFSAAPDTFPPDRFNAGVLLVTPNLTTYTHMLSSLDNTPSYDGGDTGYLNTLYPHWYTHDSSCRLPFRYNALRTVEWWTRKAPGYWDEAVGDVSILHYCSSPKVWEARKGGKLEQLWWTLHDEWRQQTEAAQRTVAGGLTEAAVVDMRQQSVLPVFSSPLLSFPASMLSVSFDAALTKRPIRYGVWTADDRSWLSLLRARYERQAKQLNAQQSNQGDVLPASPASLTISDGDTHTTTTKSEAGVSLDSSIPRHIHHIWLGSPLPAALERWVASFRLHHPTWQHTMHTSLASFPHSCPLSSPLHSHLVRLMSAASNYAEQSDILRLDVLSAYGGLYVDCDFECLTPFDALHDRPSIGLYCGQSNTGTVELNNGLIGARAGHPLLRRCMERMAVRDESSSSDSGPQSRVGTSAMDVISRTGPGHFTRVVMEWVSSAAGGGVEGAKGADDVLVLPPTFFYPLANTLRRLQADDERALFRRAESLCMHHWACSWQTDAASTNTLSSSSSSNNESATGDEAQKRAGSSGHDSQGKLDEGRIDMQRVREALAIPSGSSKSLPAGLLSRIEQFI